MLRVLGLLGLVVSRSGVCMGLVYGLWHSSKRHEDRYGMWCGVSFFFLFFSCFLFDLLCSTLLTVFFFRPCQLGSAFFSALRGDKKPAESKGGLFTRLTKVGLALIRTSRLGLRLGLGLRLRQD